LLAFLLNAISHDFFSDWPFSLIGWSNLFGLLTFGGVFLLLAVAQLYRYRAVSTPLERQQTKWIVVGLSGFLAVLLGTGVVGTVVPVLAQPGSLYLLASVVTSTLASIFIPLSFAIAILRYHLWDIDTIINKALVYGLLTGILGALYAGLIIGPESLAGLVIGHAVSNPVVLVTSTLAIAALFLPVRHQIQNVIDRRFYRRKYDAQRTLVAFSATLREGSDLEQIREQVLLVVQETMQPAHVSLWLRQAERDAEEPPQSPGRAR
jgi:MFS family permease